MTEWLVLAAGFTVGFVLGVIVAGRNAHRIVARLDPKTRLAFAHKVNALIRR